MIHRPLRAYWLAACASLMLAHPVWADSAGQVVMAVGTATATSAKGKVRQLEKADQIFSGELMNTGRASYLNIRFADGGFFLLRPQTRFEVVEHRTSPELKAAAAPAPALLPAPKPSTAPAPASAPVIVGTQATGSRALLSLLKGGFRTVSGLIGKLNHEEYRVTTPVATIGIRGTHYSARLCEGSCEDYAELASLLRLAGHDLCPNPASCTAQTLLVTHVEEGAIEITSPRETRIQGPGTTFITLADGSIIQIASLPQLETEELDMPADSCGLSTPGG